MKSGWIYSNDSGNREKLAPNTLAANVQMSENGPGLLDFIRDYTHPVGSIWMTCRDEDPNLLFGGAWTRIEGVFLLASSDDHPAGTEGGAESHHHTTGDHALKASELPQHYHGYVDYWATSWSGAGEQRSAVAVNGNSAGLSGSGANTRGRTSGVIMSANDTTYRSGSNINQSHNHGDTGETAHLPPYLTVNVWKRTA